MRRTARRATAAVALLLLLVAALLARDALEAERELKAARDRLPPLRAAISAGDTERGRAELAALQPRATAARRATDGPLWAGVAKVPWIGGSAVTARRLTTTVDALAAEVLPRLLTAADQLAAAEENLVQGQVDLDALSEAAPSLNHAQDELQSMISRRGAPSGVLPVLAAAARELDHDVERLERATRHASDAARLLPDALGARGARRYFLAFQTNAEARGTGGLVGAYGIVNADRGRLTLPVLADNRSLADLPGTGVDLGEHYQALYGRDPELWSNSNVSPHFPNAARLWLDAWAQQTGEQLDGVIATDPGGLAHLLRATGPVETPDGERVSAANVVDLTERDAYARFAGREAERKEYLVRLARAVVDGVLRDTSAGRELLRSAARAASERRLLVYSRHSREQQALRGTVIAGELPDAPGPYAAVLVNNAAGNKLDYYLARSVTYVLGRCRDDVRPTSIRVRLTNHAPSDGLSAYVAGRNDLPAGAHFERGSTRLHLALYASQGAGLARAELDGRRVAVRTGQERGHPVFLLTLELGQGQTREVMFELVEHAVAGTPQAPEQPLVLPQRTRIVSSGCVGAREVSRAGATRSPGRAHPQEGSHER